MSLEALPSGSLTHQMFLRPIERRYCEQGTSETIWSWTEILFGYRPNWYLKISGCASVIS